MSRNDSIQPTFSVIVPAYERPELLRRAVISVANQSFKEFELIIVDDNSSTDLLIEIQDALPENYKFVRLNENSGGSRTRSTGISLAKGQYIALLDSDDYWLPERLAKAWDFLKSHPGVKAMSSGTKVLKSDGKFYSSKPKPPERVSPILDFILSKGGLIQTSSLLFHRSIFNEIHFKPGLHKHQDLDIYAQLDELFIGLHYSDEELVVWDISHESQSISRNSAISHSVSWIEGVRRTISKKSYLRFWKIHILSKAPSLGDFGKYTKVFVHSNGAFDSIQVVLSAFVFRTLLIFRRLIR